MANVVDTLLIAIGIDPTKFNAGLAEAVGTAQKTEAAFEQSAQRWRGTLLGVAKSIAAPLMGIASIGAAVNSYISGVSQVAQITGAYNTKLEEWRYKRAMLSRVTQEDIQLYKKCKDATVSFNIALQDLSAKIMRSFTPAIKAGVDILYKITDWVKANEQNLVRIFQVVAGVITAVFLPSLVKMGTALLMNPLTWIIAVLGLLIIVIDDLVVYMRGGQSAFSKFWSIFGSGEEISRKITAALDWCKEVLKEFAPAILGIVAAFAGLKIAATIIGLLHTTVLSFIKALSVLAAHPIVAFILLLVGALTWLIKLFRDGGSSAAGMMQLFEAKFGSTLDKLGKVGNFLRWIIGGVGELFEYLAKAWQSSEGLWGFIATLAQDAWEGLKGLGAKVAQGISDGFKSLAENIRRAPGELLSWFGEKLAGLGNTLLKMGQSLFGGLAYIFTSIFGGIWGLITDGAQTAWNGIKAKASEISTAISAAIKRSVDDAVSWVSEKVTAIKDACSAIWDGISEKASGAWNAVKEAAGNASAWVQDQVSDLAQGAENAFTKLRGAASDIFYKVSDFASDALSTVRDQASKFYASFKEDPLGTLRNGFNSARELLSGGLDAISNKIRKTFGDTAANVFDNFIGIVGTGLGYISGAFSGAFTFITDNLLPRLSNAFPNVTAKIKEVFSEAKDFVVNKFTELVNFFSNLGEMIASAFNFDSVLAKLKEMVANAVNFLPDFLKSDEMKAWAEGAQDAAQTVQNAPNVNQQQTITNESLQNRQDNRAVNATQNNNITIVPPNGSDPQAYAQAMQSAVNDQSLAYDYVSTSEGSNLAI